LVAVSGNDKRRLDNDRLVDMAGATTYHQNDVPRSSALDARVSIMRATT
jgi:hypothetical protein